MKKIVKCIEIADGRRQHTQFDLADRTHDLNYAIKTYKEVLDSIGPESSHWGYVNFQLAQTFQELKRFAEAEEYFRAAEDGYANDYWSLAQLFDAHAAMQSQHAAQIEEWAAKAQEEGLRKRTWREKLSRLNPWHGGPNNVADAFQLNKDALGPAPSHFLFAESGLHCGQSRHQRKRCTAVAFVIVGANR